MEVEAAADALYGALALRADPNFAVGMQRYFPSEIGALGVSNAAVVEMDPQTRRSLMALGQQATR